MRQVEGKAAGCRWGCIEALATQLTGMIASWEGQNAASLIALRRAEHRPT